MARIHWIIRAIGEINPRAAQPWAREAAEAMPGAAEKAIEEAKKILEADDTKAGSALIGVYNSRGTVAAIKHLTKLDYELCRSDSEN